MQDKLSSLELHRVWQQILNVAAIRGAASLSATYGAFHGERLEGEVSFPAYQEAYEELVTSLLENEPSIRTQVKQILLTSSPQLRTINALILTQVATGWIRENRLKGGDTWDLMKRTGLSSDGLDLLRRQVERVHEAYSSLFTSSKTALKARRAEMQLIQEAIEVESHNFGKGSGQYDRVLVKAKAHLVLIWAIRLAMLHNEASTLPSTILVKFSTDGRIASHRSEVAVGITALNLGFNLQSCYSVFPLAILRGKESLDTYSTLLRSTFEELNGLVS